MCLISKSKNPFNMIPRIEGHTVLFSTVLNWFFTVCN